VPIRRLYLAPDAALRGGGQKAIGGSYARTANHQKDRNRQCQEVELKTFSLLRPRPVQKEAELMMDHCHRYEHVAKDSKGGNAGEQAEIRPNPPKNSAAMARNANTAGTRIIRVKKPIVPVNPYPPNHPSIFCAPWAKDNPQHQPKNRYGSDVFRRYELANPKVLSWKILKSNKHQMR
jgi:hypothetical protein